MKGECFMEENNKIMEYDAVKIGKRLRDTIKARKINQRDFAQLCGISYETLRTYIKGTKTKNSPKAFYRVDLLLRASDILDVPLDYLLCRDNANTTLENKEIPLADTIHNTTHLSDKASKRLISLGLDYDDNRNYKAKRHIEFIELLLCDNTLLDYLSDYYYDLKNKNIHQLFDAKDSEQCQFSKEIDESIWDELTNEDIRLLLLIKSLRKIDNLAYRKYAEGNKK